MHRNKKRSLTVMALISCFAGAPAGAATMNLPTAASNLLPAGATVQTGNLEFGNFSFTSVGGYQPNQLLVGASNGRGLTFLSGDSLHLTAEGMMGYLFAFDFNVLDSTQA